MGWGGGVLTTLKRRVLVLQAKNATMKSVPAEVCAGRKAQENEVPIKRQRKENTAGFNDVRLSPHWWKSQVSNDVVYVLFQWLRRNLILNYTNHRWRQILHELRKKKIFFKSKRFMTLWAKITCSEALLFKKIAINAITTCQHGTTRPSAGLLKIP